KPPA
uniref:Cryptide Pep-27 n=1 Tax=Tityus obscurus TaxID=1221240 RepID=CRY27_TITOB